MATIFVFSGDGESEFIDGASSSASFNHPNGLAVGPDGTVYVADTYNNAIRIISPDGTVSTYVENLTNFLGNGLLPEHIAVGPDGTIYISGKDEHNIYKSKGNTKLKVGGFYYPSGIAVGSDGTVYVADTHNKKICKIISGGTRSVWVSEFGPVDMYGKKGKRPLEYVHGIAIGPDGVLYATHSILGDNYSDTILKITPNGDCNVFAGGKVGYHFRDGKGSEAAFWQLKDIAVGPDGTVYVADSANKRIRQITPDGTVTTLAGTGEFGIGGGPALKAKLMNVSGIAVSPDGKNLYFTQPGDRHSRGSSQILGIKLYDTEEERAAKRVKRIDNRKKDITDGKIKSKTNGNYGDKNGTILGFSDLLYRAEFYDWEYPDDICFEEQLGNGPWTYVGSLLDVHTSGDYLVTPHHDQPTVFTFYDRENKRTTERIYHSVGENEPYHYKMVSCVEAERAAARNVEAVKNEWGAAAAGAQSANNAAAAARNVEAVKNEWGAAAAGVAAANAANAAIPPRNSAFEPNNVSRKTLARAARMHYGKIPNLPNIPTPPVNIGGFGKAFEEGRAERNAKKQAAKNAKNGNSRTRKSRRPRVYKSRRSSRR